MSKLIKGVNDLETLHPELAKQWRPTKNGNLIPQMFLKGSELWWKKKDLEWKQSIYCRTRNIK